jgi:hypothetical protein
MFINVPPKYLIICVTSIYCYSKFKMSGMHMTRTYCSIQLCHTISSSASAVLLRVSKRADRQTDRQTDTHTHTKPANPLQCQISRCNAHWQYQASANNLREGILKYLGLSKAHYSHKWWRNNANLCQVSDSSDKTLLTPWSRVSQSTNSLHFMKPKGSLPHSQVTTTRPYPEPYHLITKWKNVI